MTPWLILIPQFSLGLGLSVRLAPEVDVGIRLQATLAYGPLAMVTSVDLYPAYDTLAAEFVQASFLVQLSL